jgi:hypothetical protein
MSGFRFGHLFVRFLSMKTIVTFVLGFSLAVAGDSTTTKTTKNKNVGRKHDPVTAKTKKTDTTATK